jgi:hypothetical protein
MDAHEYNRLTAMQHNGWTLPGDFFIDDKFSPDLMIKVLEEKNYIGYDLSGHMILKKSLKLDIPDAYHLLMTIMNNQEQSQIDEMVDDGTLSLGISPEGKAVYTFTEDGTELISRYRGEA